MYLGQCGGVYLMNVVMGIATLITMLFCIGPLKAVLDADASYLVLFKTPAPILQHSVSSSFFSFWSWKYHSLGHHLSKALGFLT